MMRANSIHSGIPVKEIYSTVNQRKKHISYQEIAAAVSITILEISGRFSFFNKISNPDSIHNLALKKEAIISLLGLDYYRPPSESPIITEETPAITPIDTEIKISYLEADSKKGTNSQAQNDSRKESDDDSSQSQGQNANTEILESIESITANESHLLYSYNKAGSHSFVGNIKSPRGYEGNLTNGYFKAKA